jgi:hypothetical protein
MHGPINVKFCPLYRNTRRVHTFELLIQKNNKNLKEMQIHVTVFQAKASSPLPTAVTVRVFERRTAR